MSSDWGPLVPSVEVWDITIVVIDDGKLLFWLLRKSWFWFRIGVIEACRRVILLVEVVVELIFVVVEVVLVGIIVCSSNEMRSVIIEVTLEIVVIIVGIVVALEVIIDIWRVVIRVSGVIGIQIAVDYVVLLEQLSLHSDFLALVFRILNIVRNERLVRNNKRLIAH